MVETDILRAELERLFELDEIIHLSRDVLGLDPEAVGGTAAKGSFVRALTDHCLEADAVEALCDAVLASRDEVNPKLTQIRSQGLVQPDELEVGKPFGDFTLTRRLGEGRLGVSYVGRRGDADYRVKVLRSEAARDQRGLMRFLTVTRLVAQTEHAGLPSGLEVGAVGGRYYVAHRLIDGQLLSARIERTGPMHINEARPLLQGILEPLAALHRRRIAHGDLRLENVLVVRGADGATRLTLLDAGSDRLRARARAGQKELFSTVASLKTVSPEQIRGQGADPRSDVYSFGALLFEVLTGKPLFDEKTAIDAAIGHLKGEPPKPSSVAPRGWITTELDEFVLRLLNKDPDKRPADARVLLESLELLGRGSQAKREAQISDEELDNRIDALVADPSDTEAALALEAAVDEGASAERVAEAFGVAADQMEATDKESKEAKKGLLFRAARLYEHAKNDEGAEQAYVWLTELDPTDDIAITGLEDTRRRLGKYEEVVEMLLARSEQAESRVERARALADIGRLYATELNDQDQALIAYTQAFCEDAENDDYADEVERLVGKRQDAWGDVLATCNEAIAEEIPQETKSLILLRMADWYADGVSRPDLALPCLQAVIAAEPSNEAALDGMTRIYRKAQQWPELGMVLTRRADAAATPAKARDLRAEAAEILEHQLGDSGGARDLYKQVLAEDPGHVRASEALAKIYQRTGDFAGLVKILDRRADALRGEEQLHVMCRAAEIYEDHLRDDVEATRRYRAALELDDTNLDALRGVDRLLSKAGRFHELLENLARQIQLAATPRQKITLWERVAGIHDEEFLDHAKAADAWEQILSIDPAHEGALTALSRHYRALDRWEDLAELYDRHLKLVTDAPRRIELGLALGRVLSEQIGSPERATTAYERVLEADPEHAGALEALARLRESSGDADAALSAIDALAQKAASPEAKAEQYIRAAKLLEARGDRDQAIERYKLALDANPKDASASAALREAYAARGDTAAALQLLQRELEQTEGTRAKARLAAEMAKLARDRLKDDAKAEDAAKRALTLDPTNPTALMVLGDLAFEAARYVEAAAHYEQLANNADSMDKAEATRILVNYVDALSQSGSTEKALIPMDTLLRIAPDDREALTRVARVTFEHGSAKRASELHDDLLKRFSSELSKPERAAALYRYGESLRKSGELAAAKEALEQALDLNPSELIPMTSLAEIHLTEGDYAAALQIKSQHLEAVEGDERVRLLMEMGDIASEKLNDRTQAAKSYVAALEDRPDDRRLLTKLMQLYSEEKDWGKLVEVVLRLAEFVDDSRQKAKYLHSAAIVSGRQLGEVEQAIGYYERVLELDPEMTKALAELIELQRQRGDHEAVERLLERRLRRASEKKDTATLLETFTELAQLYETELGLTDKAIDALEAAHTLDPDNKERSERLANLYASDPHKYLGKAVTAQLAILRQNPYRPDSYKLLRRLYTEVKRADAAWCLCQALSVMNLAEPDEERFYRRMRSETPAHAQDAMNEQDWDARVQHSYTDPLLTRVFALIEPAVILARGQSFADLGYDQSYQVDLATDPYPMSQTLHYAAGVLGMAAPPTFRNPNDPGGLSFLHAHAPSIVLGTAALAAEIPPQAAAFIAARHLTYFRPGMYLRHLIPSGTGLKSWLFAAIKIIAPQFPVAASLEGPVREATEALERHLTAQTRDELARVVSKLLEGGGALDLKRWVAGVDLTADRAGLIVCHDLETTAEIIKASDEASSAVPTQERLKELVLYAVSEPFFELRQRLEIGVDS
ncbi:MAG: tetratricopeptide repeat protein [Polyangiaceae bacterium]|nr:tetratricopeptide repeat protein [Polyangiaceae bacterium]MCW5791912.1 tetratricopeptide repeat protein [Polyangiaceae bacterium]